MLLLNAKENTVSPRDKTRQQNVVWRIAPFDYVKAKIHGFPKRLKSPARLISHPAICVYHNQPNNRPPIGRCGRREALFLLASRDCGVYPTHKHTQVARGRACTHWYGYKRPVEPHKAPPPVQCCTLQPTIITRVNPYPGEHVPSQCGAYRFVCTGVIEGCLKKRKTPTSRARLSSIASVSKS